MIVTVKCTWTNLYWSRGGPKPSSEHPELSRYKSESCWWSLPSLQPHSARAGEVPAAILQKMAVYVRRLAGPKPRAESPFLKLPCSHQIISKIQIRFLCLGLCLDDVCFPWCALSLIHCSVLNLNWPIWQQHILWCQFYRWEIWDTMWLSEMSKAVHEVYNRAGSRLSHRLAFTLSISRTVFTLYSVFSHT